MEPITESLRSVLMASDGSTFMAMPKSEILAVSPSDMSMLWGFTSLCIS